MSLRDGAAVEVDAVLAATSRRPNVGGLGLDAAGVRLDERGAIAVVIEAWRRHYNAVRPHSSLNYLTPHEFKQQHPPSPNRAVLQE